MTLLKLGKLYCMQYRGMLLVRRCMHVNLTGKTSIHNTSRSLKDNIFLMGSPGSGKTTVGRLLSRKLGLPVVDVDDDFLEPYWSMSVADKLAEVGSSGFVQAEGEALFNFRPQGSVVSLTGSNPMYAESFDKLSKSGKVVFLDAHKEDILERLERMKVNRIVGQNDGTSMSSILDYRQQFYERSYDVRVICERNELPESVTDKVLKLLERNDSFDSTRGPVQHNETNLPYTFNQAVAEGLAPDGGLFVPSGSLPAFTTGELQRMVDLSYIERTVRILERIICGNSVSPSDLTTFINKAYSSELFGPNPFPVVPLTNTHGQYMLELFHGPTASFKDAGLQLMPQLLAHALDTIGDNRRYLIVVATSGDTGGAVLDGFSRHCDGSKVGVVVFFPEGGISNIQRHQMASLATRNAHVVGVAGADFDTCQKYVKQVFRDQSLIDSLADDNVKLSAANSISWGRLVPQLAYHISAYLDLVRSGTIIAGDTVDLCVPTGNFGNILAAYYAKKLGLPFRRLICASNTNNVLTDFFTSGVYDISQRTLALTASPAIDILVSSNLERLIYDISDRNYDLVNSCYTDLRNTGKFTVPKEMLEKMQSIFAADWCSERDCLETIKTTVATSGYLLDPHTSVAKTVADRQPNDRPKIIAATAHPGKFADTILASVFGDTSRICTAADMVDKLTNIAPRPGLSSRLTRCLNTDIANPVTCPSSYGEICTLLTNKSRSV